MVVCLGLSLLDRSAMEMAHLEGAGVGAPFSLEPFLWLTFPLAAKSITIIGLPECLSIKCWGTRLGSLDLHLTCTLPLLWPAEHIIILLLVKRQILTVIKTVCCNYSILIITLYTRSWFGGRFKNHYLPTNLDMLVVVWGTPCCLKCSQTGITIRQRFLNLLPKEAEPFLLCYKEDK